ncbi:MAG: GNAT family N-acetyltransferase [Bdellovibrio sp.]|nr:GNAT family N-acetyltransferase [Bdellovibrio sp.]
MGLELIKHNNVFDFQIRTLEVSHRDDYLDLLDQAFLVPIEGHFFDDFPVWDPRYALSMLQLGTYVESVLVATASLRVAKLKISNGLLKIGILGAVATDKKFRGLGLATHLISRLIQWAKTQDIALIFLWGSEHSLYGKQGFTLCGEQWRVNLSEMPKSTLNADVTIETGWNNEIFSFLKNRPFGLLLDEKDLPWILAHKNVKWHYVQTHGKIMAYAGVGRGIDLKNMVHEWGGDKEFLLYLLNALKKDKSDLEILGSKVLFEKYNIEVKNFKSEFLAMCKVLDFKYNPLAFPFWFWGLDGA